MITAINGGTERTSEIEASKITTTNSQQKSNPQVITNNQKQTSARHASKKTIQRLIDEIQEDNFMSARNSKVGKLPIKYQMAKELNWRQSKNQTAPQNKGISRPNLIEDDE